MKSIISRREFTKTGLMATLGLMVSCKVKNQFDIVIKNGLILDGTGSAGIRTDLGILKDKITAIDDLSHASAELIIDAKDLVISPGFIDIHTHTDTGLLVNPNAESKILQGVTTEISGNCGSSPFPLNEEEFVSRDQYLVEKYNIHVTWRDISGFLEALEQRHISINYATFTGHGDLRAYVVGKNDIAPTPEQMKRMKEILAETMHKGSLGLSTGLEYAPGSYATTEELIELCKVVSRQHGVYATHMRNEDDYVEEAIEEALRICREAEVSLQISHLKACNQSNWHKVDGMLDMIQRASEEGLSVKADRYPYIAYGTGLSIFLPLWARQGNRDEIAARLEDKNQIPEIEIYALSRGERIGGWERVLISYCNTPENKVWEGKSIQECADATGKTPFEFIRTLLLEEKNRAGIVGFAMDEDNLRKVLSSPLVMIGSDGSAVAPYGKLAEGKPHPRYYGTFPRVLGKYCREKGWIDLPVAIKKMTSMPAEKLGLKQRGKIAPNYYADLTVFDPATVIDKATFTDPHQTAQGIAYVIVNGKITVENGKHTGTHAGKILRKGDT
jgi:N-acyl-D-amino-acid deacylase